MRQNAVLTSKREGKLSMMWIVFVIGAVHPPKTAPTRCFTSATFWRRWAVALGGGTVLYYKPS